MVSMLTEPIGIPLVLQPAHCCTSPDEVPARMEIVPWNTSGATPKHQISGSTTERLRLHPAASNQFSMANLDSYSALLEEEKLSSAMSFTDLGLQESNCMARATLGGNSSKSNAPYHNVSDIGAHLKRPSLAWQDAEATTEMECLFNNPEPSEESLAFADGQPWIVVHLCGAGGVLLGEELLLQHGDVWTCFGNVMLARRGQQVMLCRHAAFSQMMNFQCASNGWDIAVNDCRCSPEEWCMLLTHEQACMDALAEFLRFMLTAASQLLVQFGVSKCSTDAASSSLPAWQTPCLQTNLWVTQSGAKMWDVVVNSKSMKESPVKHGTSPLGAMQCDSSTAMSKAIALATPRGSGIAAEQDVETQASKPQVTRMGRLVPSLDLEAFCDGEQTLALESRASNFPFYHQLPMLATEVSDLSVPTLLALEDYKPDTEFEMVKHDEPVVESERIGSTNHAAKTLFPSASNTIPQADTQDIVLLHMHERATSLKAPLCQSAPLSSEAAHPDRLLERKVGEHSLDDEPILEVATNFEAAVKSKSMPKRPTSKKQITRPHCQRSREQKARRSPCPSFSMDAGEDPGNLQRESSLARYYDALDADLCRPVKVISAARPSTSREMTRASCPSRSRDCSLSRSYDALDTFQLPAELPPVKRPSSKAAASRFSARHRATMAAASVMAWELGNRDKDRIQTCNMSPFDAKLGPDLKHRSSVETQAAPSSPNLKRSLSHKLSPASAVAMDLSNSMSSSFCTGSEFLEGQPLPKLKPFTISQAKLPPLPSQRRSANAASWSVPVATTMKSL